MKRTILLSMLLIYTCLFCLGQKRHCKLPRVAVKRNLDMQDIRFAKVSNVDVNEETIGTVENVLQPSILISEEIILDEKIEIISIQKPDRIRSIRKIEHRRKGPSRESSVKSIKKIHGLADTEQKVKIAAYILWGIAGCFVIAAIFCLIFTVNAVAPLLALGALFGIIGVICFVMAPHAGPKKTEIKF